VLIKILMFWVYLFLVVCCCDLMKFSVGLRVGRTFLIFEAEGWSISQISCTDESYNYLPFQIVPHMYLEMFYDCMSHLQISS